MSVILSCGLNNINWKLGLEVAMGVGIIADLCNYCYLHQGSCFGPTWSVHGFHNYALIGFLVRDMINLMSSVLFSLLNLFGDQQDVKVTIKAFETGSRGKQAQTCFSLCSVSFVLFSWNWD